MDMQIQQQKNYFNGTLILEQLPLQIQLLPSSLLRVQTRLIWRLMAFYLSKVPPLGMMIYSQPLPDTICNTGNANFTVHVVAGATFQWQVNEGGTWQNTTDNNQYSGPMSDSLSISNTDAGMNNYQYRCYLSTACCNVYSAPATLVVLPYFTPSVTITTASNNICKQDTATFTACVSTPLQNTFFQWKKQDVDVGKDTTVYSDGNISDRDVISCFLTTNEACATPASVVSNKIVMTVEAIDVLP